MGRLVGACATVIALLLAATAAAAAAPFCLASLALPRQCIYFEAASCLKRAAQLQAFCEVNPVEVKILRGTQPYCLADSALSVACIYTSHQSCEAEAVRKRAICFAAVTAGQSPSIDPFRDIRP